MRMKLTVVGRNSRVTNGRAPRPQSTYFRPPEMRSFLTLCGLLCWLLPATAQSTAPATHVQGVAPSLFAFTNATLK